MRAKPGNAVPLEEWVNGYLEQVRERLTDGFDESWGTPDKILVTDQTIGACRQALCHPQSEAIIHNGALAMREPDGNIVHFQNLE